MGGDTSEVKDSDNSQAGDLEEEEENDDPRLTYLLTNNQLPNEWRWKDRQTTALVDHARCVDNKKTNDLIEKVVKDSWFGDEVKAKLIEALKDVLFRNLPRGAAAVSNDVDWTDLGALLTEIYDRMGLLHFGDTNIEIPRFDLQYMENKPDAELEPLDVHVEPEPQPVTSEKEQNTDEDEEEEFGELDTSVSKKKSGNRTKKQNCYSNLGKVVDGKKYARYGVIIPQFWKEYPDLMRAGIWKSIEMRVNKVPSEKCHIVEDDVKFKAIEEVLLNEGSCKGTAIKYGINYSTMQNYAHRAIYVLSKIMGETELRSKVKDLLDREVSVKEICDNFHIKRPQSQVRVSFGGINT
uniref:Homeodomain-like DNA binding domain-containing transcription factor n=1 Tax=Bursaphelenchus xylophilus TaxID=6326 RepID=A0A1I7RR70_BURXY